MITIKENDIILRSFSEDDIPKKVSIINDEKNNKFLHYDLPLSIANTKKWFDTLYKKKNRIDLTILENKKVAGFIGLLSIDEKNKKAEYYICIDHNFSGRGLGTLASKMLINYAFDELGLNKIYLYTEQDNIPAQKLFEKLKFKQEGLFKDDLIHNGKNIDRYAYGLIKENYE